MNPQELWTSFFTILRKDTIRQFRVWSQTFLPSVVTSVLYFLVFGSVIGDRIQNFGEFSYIHFIVPGLVMLAVITNSYSNVAFTFFTGKFFSRNIDEILVSPTPPWLLIAGYVAGGVVRGVITGILVILISLFFAVPPLENILVLALFLVLSSVIFSLAGLVNGIYAKNFDGITIVPTFVLTPLVYLGGVFYSVDMLPEVWKTLTHFNPIFYLINGFRYGFLGITDVSISLSIAVLVSLTMILVGINWYMIKKGLGLRQ
jgi:ABC-2 type transport system permease protein